jgi:hypothetical protein
LPETSAQRKRRDSAINGQVLASLLVSVFLVGIKFNAAKELVQLIERQKELRVNLTLLLRRLEDEDRDAWISDVQYDTKAREDRIAEMDSAPRFTSSTLENVILQKGAAMFAVFESSSARLMQLKHSATVMSSESKLDKATGLLLGRASAVVRAAPQDIVMHLLNQDSRHAVSLVDRAVMPRYEVFEHVNPHHTILFIRGNLGAGLSHRTFLTSTVAQRVADDPPAYMVVGAPIAHHAKITREGERGAVRAENCRAFKLTEVAPGVTKMEYACSLNLGGSIPQAITNKIAVPGQMHGATPPPARPPHCIGPGTSLSVRLLCLAHSSTSSRGDFALINYGLKFLRGVLQCRRRCSCTFSTSGHLPSATLMTAELSDTCSWILLKRTRRISRLRSASLRTAQRCFASAAFDTWAKCSRRCLLLRCTAPRSMIHP